MDEWVYCIVSSGAVVGSIVMAGSNKDSLRYSCVELVCSWKSFTDIVFVSLLLSLEI